MRTASRRQAHLALEEVVEKLNSVTKPLAIPIGVGVHTAAACVVPSAAEVNWYPRSMSVEPPTSVDVVESGRNVAVSGLHTPPPGAVVEAPRLALCVDPRCA